MIQGQIIKLIDRSLGDFQIMGDKGSGHRGHKGRLGKRGGSLPGKVQEPVSLFGRKKEPIKIPGDTLRTSGARIRMGVGGQREAFEIMTIQGARASGYLRNADFPGEYGKATRGELVYVTAGIKHRRGIGTSLALDSFRAMRTQGAKTVNISVTTEEGRALVRSLIRKGYISKPIQTSSSGKSEHTLLKLD